MDTSLSSASSTDVIAQENRYEQSILTEVSDKEILIIYTGGTIGMDNSSDGSLDTQTGCLKSFMDQLFALTVDDIPAYDLLEWEEPVDSSNFSPQLWEKLVVDIKLHYHRYNGFVVLMGTDTMTFTASAVSFAFENLAKPIIFTGSQIPIVRAYSDGRRNLTVALLAAANLEIPEVCIYFNSKLLRGNRSKKLDSWGSCAFESPNYCCLAKMGNAVKVSKEHLPMPKKKLVVHQTFSDKIVVVYLAPGFADEILLRMVSDGGDNAYGLVLMLYGTGNAPNHHKQKFMHVLETMIQSGVEIVVVSQCRKGFVNMNAYATGKQLLNIGLINARDMTVEAAVAKLSHLMGRGFRGPKLKKWMEMDLRGEISELSSLVPYYGFPDDVFLD